MNKKGQLGVLAAVFAIFIFILFWAMAAGGLLKQVGEDAVIEHGYTGLTAFILVNMNLFVFIGLLLAVIVYVGFGLR